METNNEQESTAISRVPILIFCVVVMLIMGFPYIYSIILPQVMTRFDVDTATASWPYSAVLASFVIGNLIGGQWQRKSPVKLILGVGLLLMVLGVGLTAFVPSDKVMWLTFGFLYGLGDGIVYNVVLTIVQKWWANRRGFATGILLAALAISTSIFSPLASGWFKTLGFSTTFLVVAGIFVAIGAIGVATLRNPPDAFLAQMAAKQAANAPAATNAVTIKQYAPGEMVKTSQFFRITLSFTLFVPAYVLISAIFVAFGTEKGLAQTTLITGVMLASLSQVAGRFIISAVSDKVGRKGAVSATLIITIAAALLLVVANGALYVFCFMLASFAYAGGMATYPSLTSDHFGVKNAGINYALVLIGMVVASILCPFLSRAVRASALGTPLSFAIAGIAGAISLLLVLTMKTNEAKA
jgi:MFS family permease